MYPIHSTTWHDQQLLGHLAMRFRSTRDLVKRRAIADDYSAIVQRLIDSGTWDEIPSPEDLLPDDWLPKTFFDYWLR